MIGDHVPERAGPLVKSAAPLDPDGLGRSDLDVVDVRAIPDRLEEAVGEAQRHDVLHRFLAEEMVDPIDLVLREGPQDVGVERPGGGKVMAEWLFDYDPAPLPFILIGESRFSEAGYCGAEETVGDREVEEVVAGGPRFLVEPGEMIAEPSIASGSFRSPCRYIMRSVSQRHAAWSS